VTASDPERRRWSSRPRPTGRPTTTGSRPPGRHNAANALASRAASVLGLTPDAIATHLATFAGHRRRLERKGEAAGVVVYDDYGHHPTAIRETSRPSASASPAAASGPSTSR
jgi:UDP-N-acetylmuramate: L-alanyl-gamma-D-glutamyl-meso-diaminopimelate ligase